MKHLSALITVMLVSLSFTTAFAADRTSDIQTGVYSGIDQSGRSHEVKIYGITDSTSDMLAIKSVRREYDANGYLPSYVFFVAADFLKTPQWVAGDALSLRSEDKARGISKRFVGGDGLFPLPWGNSLEVLTNSRNEPVELSFTSVRGPVMSEITVTITQKLRDL